MKKKIAFSIFIAFFILYFNNPLFAAFRTGLPHNPDWKVDEEIAGFVPGWNQGYFKCRPPKGGYNEIIEKQKILNSWGYKARPIEEIKDLLPEPNYELYSNPEIWGTIRINETPWEAVKPRGVMWEKFMAQSEKNKKVCYIDEDSWLRGYKYGIPFPELDEKDPQIAVKLMWNFLKKYQDNDREVPMDICGKDRRGYERHNLFLNRRIQMRGRVRDDSHTQDGLYYPNLKNFELVYTCPYVSPYNLRGTIVLYYRYNDPSQADDLWIYIPSIRRVRRMSTAQTQDRVPGGLDWTWDNAEGFEGNVTKFNCTYLGRKEMLVPVCAHSHAYWDPTSWLNSPDQYYQRRLCYGVKCTYKEPVNMTDIEVWLDPVFFNCPFAINRDMKGRDWIVVSVSSGRGKNWFYTMYNDYAIDILRKHASRAQFAYSGGIETVIDNFTMETLKREFLSR